MDNSSTRKQVNEINKQIVAVERDITSVERDLISQHENTVVLKHKLLEVFNKQWPTLKIIRK
jgi:DNA-binding FrmR family transcriptional regulator